ncbi:hypothetical protein HDU76_006852 [Blyttiomyces sp. JEL0837]|nr:hypothetical protein HDU76_006852 [Blyttiomyces sp. JEL0837]
MHPADDEDVVDEGDKGSAGLPISDIDSERVSDDLGPSKEGGTSDEDEVPKSGNEGPGADNASGVDALDEGSELGIMIASGSELVRVLTLRWQGD